MILLLSYHLALVERLSERSTVYYHHAYQPICTIDNEEISKSKIPSCKYNENKFLKNLQGSYLQEHIYSSEIKNKQGKQAKQYICLPSHSAEKSTALQHFPMGNFY